MRDLRFTAIAAVLMLAACSGNSVKQTLGLNREGPDEFKVVSRPPLSVPPQFDLRPPSATDDGAGQTPASQQAQSMVLGTDKPAATANGKPASSAESEFLKKAGATQADPSVREKLVQDRIRRDTAEEDSSWWDVFGTHKPKDPLVNAKKESERIKTNEAEGKPVDEGDTPTVKDRDTGVLGRILGY